MFFRRMGTTLLHPALSSWWWLHLPPNTSSESEEEDVDDNDELEPDIVLLPDNQDDADEVRVIGQSISPSSIRPPSPDIIEIVAVDCMSMVRNQTLYLY